MNGCSRTTSQAGRRDDSGFTLVEILIAIVLVGVLSAVVVVGISSLTNKGAKSACGASLDAAKAGTTVYFANYSRYPQNFTELTSATGTGAATIPPAVTLPSGVIINTVAATAPAAPIGRQLQAGTTWQLTMTVGASTAIVPTFVCTP